MKIKTSRLEAIAAIPSQYPEGTLPEIAFAGRSNVGKSSFLNAVINRKNLARTSGKPGKTRTINFYNVNEEFRLVDLPGYGYAAVSKAEKAQWGKIIETYLMTREQLAEVILLVDIRHEPSAQDVQMYDWISAYGFEGYVMATKADKISRGSIARHVNIVAKTEDRRSDENSSFSATTKYGWSGTRQIGENLTEENEDSSNSE